MIRELTIKNYKSILDHTIELGRINVFIGENGCGKTNILEAVAMAAAALTDKLSVEELWNRGMRVARTGITLSSFSGVQPAPAIDLRMRFEGPDDKSRVADLRIAPAPGKRAGKGGAAARVAKKRASTPKAASRSAAARTAWLLTPPPEKFPGVAGDPALLAKIKLFGEMLLANDHESKPLQEQAQDFLRALPQVFSDGDAKEVGPFLREAITHRMIGHLLGDFAIYNANILALRGLQTVSRREPLGVHGEALHAAIAELEPDTWKDVLERVKCISWVEGIVVDPTDKLKYEGHKLLQSDSTLYFRDKFMRRKDNVFSAENVNEGILHILFYLTLFVSQGTPRIFGIDNIETALNPQLCRDLMKQLAELSVSHDKQAFITTHNPAILDGLNLHDEEQRLFVVSRSDEGPTRTRRIKVKPQPEGQQLKLSELWMRGHLGGIPRSF